MAQEKTDNSWKTAIKRTKPSAPMRWLYENKFLRGKVLDYGCGRGFDADHYGFHKWDPYFFPGHPQGKFDTIVSNYVLNVLPKEQQTIALWKIKGMLKPHGCAFITVRRDINKDHKTKAGTIQNVVRLDLDVIKENSKFCIYFMPGKLYCLPSMGKLDNK